VVETINQPVYWDDRNSKGGADGQIRGDIFRALSVVAVRSKVRLNPAISQLSKQDQFETQAFDARLKKGTGPAASSPPDGNPAPEP